jgi:hypothetical protein
LQSFTSVTVYLFQSAKERYYFDRAGAVTQRGSASDYSPFFTLKFNIGILFVVCFKRNQLFKVSVADLSLKDIPLKLMQSATLMKKVAIANSE